MNMSPATNTFPFFNVNCAWEYRPCFMCPVIFQTSVDGSYNSVLFRRALAEGLPSPSPPTTNTFPFINTESVCQLRATFILFVIVHVFVDASYSSAEFSRVLPYTPPAANTFPFCNKDAVNHLVCKTVYDETETSRVTCESTVDLTQC